MSKLLYIGSPEYAFWMHFFSSFSPSHRDQFAERVELSKDGSISWDFFLASNASPEYQYEDVLEIMVTSLFDTRTLGFKKEYLGKMLLLASDVHRERDEQMYGRDGDFTEHDSAILQHLNYFWDSVEKRLDEIIQKWYSKNENGK